MTHLGERVVDLVDGQLPPADAERANAHLASYRSCRDLVEAERLTKARLAALAGPEPSDDFLGRLLAIAAPGDVVSQPGAARPDVAPPPFAAPDERATERAAERAAEPVPAPAAARPRTVAVAGSRAPGAGSPSGRRPGRSVRPGGVPAAAAVATRPRRSTGVAPRAGRRVGRSRLAAAVIGAVGAFGAGVAALAVAAPAGTGNVVPTVDSFVVQHVTTTVRLPILDIPAGWQLTRRGTDGSREGSRTTR